MKIAIEGIDGSGKTTVIREIQNRFADLTVLDFPDYHSAIGKAIGRILHEKKPIDPVAMATLYAVNRCWHWHKFYQIRPGRMILNRYVPSNIAYHLVQVPELERQELANYITELEYTTFNLPKPDLIVYLRIPVDLALVNVAKKARRIYTDRAFDLYETKDHLTAVAEVYENMQMYHPYGTFITLDTVANNDLLDVSSIANQVVQIIQEQINKENHNV